MEVAQLIIASVVFSCRVIGSPYLLHLGLGQVGSLERIMLQSTAFPSCIIAISGEGGLGCCAFLGIQGDLEFRREVRNRTQKKASSKMPQLLFPLFLVILKE